MREWKLCGSGGEGRRNHEEICLRLGIGLADTAGRWSKKLLSALLFYVEAAYLLVPNAL
jgi:hypothetical protein